VKLINLRFKYIVREAISLELASFYYQNSAYG